MFCEKCGKKISDDSAFCEFCGQKIECGEKKENLSLEKKKGQKKENDQIASDNLKQIANHLEFLGYEIHRNELTEKDKRESLFVNHPDNLNLTILEMLPNFIIFRTLMATEKKPSAKIDAFLNDMNKNFLISKIYREVEDNKVYLRIESVYIGDYVKDIFGRFIDMNIREHSQLRASDDFGNLFVD